jgi:hypothetical protein
MATTYTLQFHQIRLHCLNAGSTDDHMVSSVDGEWVAPTGEHLPISLWLKQTVGSTFDPKNIELARVEGDLPPCDAQDLSAQVRLAFVGALRSTTGEPHLMPGRVIKLRDMTISLPLTLNVKSAGRDNPSW